VSLNVRVELASHGYDILIESGLLARAGEALQGVLKKPRALIVTDSHVAALHLVPLVNSLQAASIKVLPPIIVAPGEETKSLANFEKLMDEMLSRAVDRGINIIALGGGVVGDLAGFAAATLLRGVDFIQIPTSLLAQVDSSVGGKTGVNTRYGKNLVGAFYQPQRVLIDPEVLNTLPLRELQAGYAEVVKYGLIDMPDFFNWCEQNGPALLAGNQTLRAEAIAQSCQAKARIVAADEREQDVRALLNLGHTFGHALEAEAGYDGRLLHGEGVAVGMVLAARLSAQLGLCGAEVAQRLGQHLKQCNMPATIADTVCRNVPRAQLLQHMFKDKKVQDGRLTFILLRGIGQAFVKNDVPPEAVLELLNSPEPAFA